MGDSVIPQNINLLTDSFIIGDVIAKQTASWCRQVSTFFLPTRKCQRQQAGAVLKMGASFRATLADTPESTGPREEGTGSHQDSALNQSDGHCPPLPLSEL